jgi:drug/metabolite transporter (DMT)-like permease
MGAVSWLGIGITILGVAWVVTEKSATDEEKNKLDWKGVFFGFLAALTQAVGAVLSRWALTETPVSALQSAVIRLLAGIIVLILWVVIRRESIGQWLHPRPSLRFWGVIVAVIFLGTYVAIWFQQLAFQHTQVGVAQTLLATSPMFILPIAALLGEKLSPRAIFGVCLSISGVALLFLVQ